MLYILHLELDGRTKVVTQIHKKLNRESYKIVLRYSFQPRRYYCRIIAAGNHFPQHARGIWKYLLHVKFLVQL